MKDCRMYINGAFIENGNREMIPVITRNEAIAKVAPFMGAWIETCMYICSAQLLYSHPYRGA